VSEAHGRQHLVLVGMRGSGKTTVGPLVAEQLGWPFVDLDGFIAASEGVESAGALLLSVGEAAFRCIEERELARVLAEKAPIVIAAGGGIVEMPACRDLLKERALCVWLRAAAPILRARLEADETERPPLLGGNSQSARDEVQAVLERRSPLYAGVAIHEVDASDEAWSVAARILAAIS